MSRLLSGWRPGDEDDDRAARPFRVHAPLVRMTKAQDHSAGVELGVDYSLTHSCL